MAILSESSSSKKEERAKEMMNLALRSISQVIFTCRTILLHDANGFTSPPKKGVLRNFISLKKSIVSTGV
jgi:hypothetical protein